MTVKIALEYAEFALLALSLVTLVVMALRRVLRAFPLIAMYLGLISFTATLDLSTGYFRKALGLSRDLSFNLNFYGNIVLGVVQVALMIAAIYGIFRMAIRPFPGLHRMGKIVFRWVAVVSVGLGLVAALGPHVTATGYAYSVIFSMILERVQESIGLLSLCLLLFVCIAIKPLGLTFRSHLFGASVGLGVISTTLLVEAAWFATSQFRSIYSPLFLANALGYCAAVAIWGGYFAVPEPERKMLLLPTTSPFHFWNKLSEALGDAPGNVAISFKPSAMAPVELKVLEEMGKAQRQKADAANEKAHVANEQGQSVAS